jgi:hypothetical protein
MTRPSSRALALGILGIESAAASTVSGALERHVRRGALRALIAVAALACAASIVACGGSPDAVQPTARQSTAQTPVVSMAEDAPVTLAGAQPGMASIGCPTLTQAAAPPSRKDAITPEAAAHAAARAREKVRQRTAEEQAALAAVTTFNALWGEDGRARTSLPEDRPADPAARWSGERYATRAQLALQELAAAPYTMVIDADDEAAARQAFELADTMQAHGASKQHLGLFVRSRQPALAARLAERLTREQGWANVFVVY